MSNNQKGKCGQVENKIAKQTTLERFANFDKHTKKLSEMKQKKSQSSTFKQTKLRFDKVT